MKSFLSKAVLIAASIGALPAYAVQGPTLTCAGVLENLSVQEIRVINRGYQSFLLLSENGKVLVDQPATIDSQTGRTYVRAEPISGSEPQAHLLLQVWNQEGPAGTLTLGELSEVTYAPPVLSHAGILTCRTSN